MKESVTDDWGTRKLPKEDNCYVEWKEKSGNIQLR